MNGAARMDGLRIREMAEQDLIAVYANEIGTYSHPWTEGILRDCLRVGYSCWVCERNGSLIGHAVVTIAAGEAHLLNLCIVPSEQARGYGRKLLHRVLRVVRESDADTLYLEVRESNSAARRLYESEGFAELGLRRGYYPLGNGREDAVLYAKAL